MATIGERIRARRIELNMTQLELAQHLGYKSSSSINKIEKDGRGLPMKKINQIAEALNTTPDYIMGWDETPKNVNTDQNTRKILKITMSDGTIFECDMTKIIEAIVKNIKDLNEPAQNKVLNYVEDLRENKKNFRDYVESIQKRKK